MDPLPAARGRGCDAATGALAVVAGREWPNEILTRYEVDLVPQAKKKSHTDSEQRDRAIVLLMYRAELRVSQVSNLKRTEYDRAGRQLKLGSDRKHEIVGLDAETAAALDAWIDERQRLKIQSSHVFCVVKKDATQGSKPGKPLHTSNIRSCGPGRSAGRRRRQRPHPAGETTGYGSSARWANSKEAAR